jgi:hypothetical protein
MIKTGKKLFLFSTFFMCILMVTFGINGSLVCSATDLEYSDLAAPEKTLAILNDVVGLDTATYSTNLDTYIEDLYFEVLPQEDVKYTLESDESKLEVICSFVTEKLRSMITYTDGSPHMTRASTNTLEMAKEFINKYQTVSNSSYYSMMESMLDNLEINKNATKTSGNTKLEVNGNASYTSFRWTYTVNGVEAPSKCVVLKFENGFLKYFVDTWSFYTVGNTDLNISEDEAVDIAMKATENYSWNVSMGDDKTPVTVTEFNIVGISETTAMIGNYPTKNESRDGDPFTLYPGWQIKLYFDKLYPGKVYGLDIGIWADTGEVHDISPMMWTGDYPPDENINDNETAIELKSNEESNGKKGSNLTSIMLTALPITVVLGITIVYSKRKTAPNELHEAPKSNSIKLRGVLLCLLISLTMIPMTISIPTVNADTYVMPVYGSTLNITLQEEQWAETIADSFASKFSTYAGYTTYNLFGSQTQKQTVLSHASEFEQNFDHVAMFHYGHGGYVYVVNQKHWDYFDDYGMEDYRQIRDYMVYPNTGQNKHFFVILWSCRQADEYPGYDDPYGRAVGMPYAWHHGVDANSDCFIGFAGASMPLNQKSEHHGWLTYGFWLNMFAYYLTINHRTIIQALNDASLYQFNRQWTEMELYTGFTAVWPDFGSGNGWMKVYGNSNMYVY